MLGELRPGGIAPDELKFGGGVGRSRGVYSWLRYALWNKPEKKCVNPKKLS